MKEKTIKIGFRNFWEGFNAENNFFTNLLRKKYEVIISNNPDYLFYSVYPEATPPKNLSTKGDLIRSISPELYIFLRKFYSLLRNVFYRKYEVNPPRGDFIKIFYGAEKVRPDMEECDFAFSTFPEREINHPNYMRLQTNLVTDFLLGEEGKLSLNRNVDFKETKKEKTKFCNFIYSQDTLLRNSFFKKLNKYKRVDSPGRCMNNMSPIGSYTNSKESRISINWAKEKLNFLKKYKFTIAFENELKDWYTTEKLIHPLLVNSIPIYFGNKKVGEDFNKKCFINYHDFKTVKKLIEHIREVDTNDELYFQYLRQPFFKNKKQYDFSVGKAIERRLNKIIESKKNE